MRSSTHRYLTNSAAIVAELAAVATNTLEATSISKACAMFINCSCDRGDRHTYAPQDWARAIDHSDATTLNLHWRGLG